VQCNAVRQLRSTVQAGSLQSVQRMQLICLVLQAHQGLRGTSYVQRGASSCSQSSRQH
jgi:hypothetical protein